MHECAKGHKVKRTSNDRPAGGSGRGVDAGIPPPIGEGLVSVAAKAPQVIYWDHVNALTLLLEVAQSHLRSGSGGRRDRANEGCRGTHSRGRDYRDQRVAHVHPL